MIFSTGELSDCFLAINLAWYWLTDSFVFVVYDISIVILDFLPIRRLLATESVEFAIDAETHCEVLPTFDVDNENVILTKEHHSFGFW